VLIKRVSPFEPPVAATMGTGYRGDAMALMNKQRRKEQPVLPDKFRVRFWEDMSGRYANVKKLRKRYEQLKKQVGANSVMKEYLCQRAAFLVVQIESLETVVMESGQIDKEVAAVHTQMGNALKGLLNDLGLERKDVAAPSLKEYVNNKRSA
jgi:hypothetical protein